MVLPAHAGVIPIGTVTGGNLSGSSRTRGGDPEDKRLRENQIEFFPHTRG